MGPANRAPSIYGEEQRQAAVLGMQRFMCVVLWPVCSMCLVPMETREGVESGTAVQMVLSYHVGVKNQTQVFWKTISPAHNSLNNKQTPKTKIKTTSLVV